MNKIAKCDDCGMLYGEDDWVDTVMPHFQWKIISPENGILCANCIVKRASKLENIRILKTELIFSDDDNFDLRTLKEKIIDYKKLTGYDNATQREKNIISNNLIKDLEFDAYKLGE